MIEPIVPVNWWSLRLIYMDFKEDQLLKKNICEKQIDEHTKPLVNIRWLRFY